MIRTIQTLEELKQYIALEKDKYILIKFYAPWCGPCRIMDPVFKNAVNEIETDDKHTQLKSQLCIIEINRDNANEIIPFLGLNSFTIPRFFIGKTTEDEIIAIKDLGGTQSKTRLIDQVIGYINE